MNDDHISDNRLTVETALWVLLVAAALALRLTQLGVAPLTAAEAREATLAWRAATGRGLPTAEYNPVLLAANALLFSLFDTSDFLARLVPALFGAFLVLSPVLLRPHLGRVGALAAGLYLVISPTALVASRQLAGTAIAASGVMASVGGVARFFETKSRGWLTFAVVGLALAVTSDATAYSLLFPLGLAWVAVSQLWPEGRPSGLRSCVIGVRHYARQLLVTFVLVLFALCTGLGWNLSGVGAVGDLLVDWFGRFRSTSSPAVSPLTLLMVYELFGVTLGIGGLIWGLRRGRYLAALLGLWGALEVLLLAVMRGRIPTDLLWAVLPLALLAGLSVQVLVRGWSPSDCALQASHAVLVMVLWAYAYLMLGRYAAFGDREDLALVVIAVVLQVLLGLSFRLVLGPVVPFRTAAAATAVAVLALTLSAAWGVAYERPADPREALLSAPTALGIRNLVQTLHDLSWEQTGMPSTLEFVFEAPEDSVLTWYLRGFEKARRVDGLGDVRADDLGAVVVAAGPAEAVSGAVGAAYSGQDFAVHRQWSPRALECRFWESGCNVAVGWFLFRDAPPLPEAMERATLWRLVGEVPGN